mmetsp:Transcript_22186/g.50531  ORF Transcript_22186/g.50531 Transcript_22186/m.50531 type:complete len:207 (+) Transcript_22186:157-777(+)
MLAETPLRGASCPWPGNMAQEARELPTPTDCGWCGCRPNPSSTANGLWFGRTGGVDLVLCPADGHLAPVAGVPACASRDSDRGGVGGLPHRPGTARRRASSCSSSAKAPHRGGPPGTLALGATSCTWLWPRPCSCSARKRLNESCRCATLCSLARCFEISPSACCRNCPASRWTRASSSWSASRLRTFSAALRAFFSAICAANISA